MFFLVGCCAPVEYFKELEYVDRVICFPEIARDVHFSLRSLLSRPEDLVDNDRKILVSGDALFEASLVVAGAEKLSAQLFELELYRFSSTFERRGCTWIGLTSSRMISPKPAFEISISLDSLR